MSKFKIAIFAMAGTAKKELMAQELSQSEIAVQLENGLKDLKKLISFYTLNKKGDYRIEIGDKGFNFVGNKFAGSLSQVLHMVAARQLASEGKGAELKSITELAGSLEESIVINPELLDKVSLADRVLDGSETALTTFSAGFLIENESGDE